jgi:hypothetical protein
MNNTFVEHFFVETTYVCLFKQQRLKRIHSFLLQKTKFPLLHKDIEKGNFLASPETNLFQRRCTNKPISFNATAPSHGYLKYQLRYLGARDIQ